MTKEDMRQEYDFSQLDEPVRGKYAEAFAKGSNLVLLDADVAQAFPDGQAVNDSLRLLKKLAKKQVGETPHGT